MTRILLVEDNHLNRDMFARRLERKGFQVVCAANGREAVEKARSLEVGLILMDLNLPILDGWEATRKIKADPATRTIPIIALTAHAMVGDREKALAAGCDDYETKPVDLPRLLTKIERLAGPSPLAPLPARPASSPVLPNRRVVPGFDNGPPSGSVPASWPGSTPEVNSPLILVADDNPLNCDLLTRRLLREGFRVSVTHNGKDTLDQIGRQHFDLLLLDLMMPEMNGFEVLQSLRASHSRLDLPVIVLTARDQSEDTVQALGLGANDYVTKPFDFAVLVARIRNQLALARERTAPETPREGVTAERLLNGQARANSSPPHGGIATRTPLTPLSREPSTPLDPRSNGSSTRLGLSAEGKGTGSWQDSAAVEGPLFADYEILEERGRGGMGIVYKARHRRMKRVVALKIIHKEHLARADSIQRFYREIQAAAQLSHPNIVVAYDAGEFNGTHFFAMEFVEGLDLDRLIQRHGPLPVEVACGYVLQVAAGLQHAHEHNLVHRDVKPCNLLAAWKDRPSHPGQPITPQALTPPLEKATIKILDFGLALLYESASTSEAAAGLTRDGRVVGTADYMAPEQWMNARKVDVRADLYSLGCTFYYLLTGSVPFPADEPMEKMLKHHLDEPVRMDKLRAGLPTSLAGVVRKLMAKKPDHRYQAPWEVIEAVQPFVPEANRGT